MKKNNWMGVILAALVFIAGSEAIAISAMSEGPMMQCGMTQGDMAQCPMMQGGAAQCPMTQGNTAQCPMTQGSTAQCPMTQDGQRTGCAMNTGGASAQPQDMTAMTRKNMTQSGNGSGDAMNMDCASMMACDPTACICDHSSGNGCVNNTGMMCMCCDMCASGGMCSEGCCAMDELDAVIDIIPGNLNLLGSGRYINVYIELAENESGLTVDNIDKSTIYLKQVNNIMCPAGEKIYPVGPISYGDYDEDGVNDLMAKFNRRTLISLFLASGNKTGDALIYVAGELYDGTQFNGNQTIKVKGMKIVRGAAKKGF